MGGFKIINNYIYKMFNVTKISVAHSSRLDSRYLPLQCSTAALSVPHFRTCKHTTQHTPQHSSLDFSRPLPKLHATAPSKLATTTSYRWDRTRAAGVGVQYANEWATKYPIEYVLVFDIYSEYSCALYAAISSILFYY